MGIDVTKLAPQIKPHVKLTQNNHFMHSPGTQRLVNWSSTTLFSLNGPEYVFWGPRGFFPDQKVAAWPQKQPKLINTSNISNKSSLSVLQVVPTAVKLVINHYVFINWSSVRFWGSRGSFQIKKWLPDHKAARFSQMTLEISQLFTFCSDWRSIQQLWIGNQPLQTTPCLPEPKKSFSWLTREPIRKPISVFKSLRKTSIVSD